MHPAPFCVLYPFVLSLYLQAPPGPPARLAAILNPLCAAIAAQMAKNPAIRPLLWLAWTHCRRVIMRFSALASRPSAPPPRKAPPARTTPKPAPEPSPDAARRPSKYQRLPGGSAWLCRLVPEARPFRSQLHYWLTTDPEIAAFLQSAPRAGRILRPLCRLLGMRPLPPLLAPPPRPGREAHSCEPAQRPRPTRRRITRHKQRNPDPLRVVARIDASAKRPPPNRD